jgi:prolyl 4-hydroxylase
MINESTNFLTKEECDLIVSHSEDKFSKANTLGKNNDYRIAEGCWLKDDELNIGNIRKKISELINLPLENLEAFHVVKYGVGGKYDVHYDYFQEGTEYYQEQMNRGGQRLKTALMYLNDDFEGGETFFPKFGLKISPVKGKLLSWDNVVNGKTNPFSSHAGLPVKSGFKYIAVIWAREKKFI